MKIAVKTALLAGLLLAGTAQADLVGRYSLPGGHSLEIFYQDDDSMRVNLENQGYMLVDGDNMFMVMQQAGMEMAMDLKQIGQMASQMRDQALGPEQETADLVPRIEDTGQEQQVGEYQGRVHRVSYGDRETQVVLTKDPEVATLTQAFLRVMTRLGDAMSAEDSKAAAAVINQLEETGYSGLLKQADGVILQSVAEVDRPDSFYQLPAGVPVVQMPTVNIRGE